MSHRAVPCAVPSCWCPDKDGLGHVAHCGCALYGRTNGYGPNSQRHSHMTKSRRDLASDLGYYSMGRWVGRRYRPPVGTAGIRRRQVAVATVPLWASPVGLASILMSHLVLLILVVATTALLDMDGCW